MYALIHKYNFSRLIVAKHQLMTAYFTLFLSANLPKFISCILICNLVECCNIKSSKLFEIWPSMTRISESTVFLVFNADDDQLVSINPYTSVSDIYSTLLKDMTCNSPCRNSQTLISMVNILKIKLQCKLCHYLLLLYSRKTIYLCVEEIYLCWVSRMWLFTEETPLGLRNTVDMFKYSSSYLQCAQEFILQVLVEAEEAGINNIPKKSYVYAQLGNTSIKHILFPTQFWDKLSVASSDTAWVSREV